MVICFETNVSPIQVPQPTCYWKLGNLTVSSRNISQAIWTNQNLENFPHNLAWAQLGIFLSAFMPFTVIVLQHSVVQYKGAPNGL